MNDAEGFSLRIYIYWWGRTGLSRGIGVLGPGMNGGGDDEGFRSDGRQTWLFGQTVNSYIRKLGMRQESRDPAHFTLVL